MTAQEILNELQSLGSESYKNLLMRNHGVREPFYGVKVGDLKKIQKRIKKDYQLALNLYSTGNYDAMYLAGLIADDAKMTRKDLQSWVENAIGGALPGSTVPWVAAGSPDGWSLALEWIDSPRNHIAEAGWNTLGYISQLKPDAELEIADLRGLLSRVRDTIHQAPDTVRYAMNQFLMMVGGSVASLTEEVKEIARQIGPVSANLGSNHCQIPSVIEALRKNESAGKLGRKKNTVKC